MIFLLIGYGLVGLIVFLVAWLRFGAELGVAVLMAILSTATVAALIYGLAELGHSF